MTWQKCIKNVTWQKCIKNVTWQKCITQKKKKKYQRGMCSSNLLRVVKNVTWRQRVINEVLYAGSPRISTTIRERCLRFSGHCWTSEK